MVEPRRGPQPLACAGGRRALTRREIATIRAALRLWTTLRSDEIAEDALAAAHAEILDVGHPAAVILADAEIEELLAELGLAGELVIPATVDPLSDPRRV